MLHKTFICFVATSRLANGLFSHRISAMYCFLVLRFFLHPVMEIKVVVILSAMYSWIVWIEFGSSYWRNQFGPWVLAKPRGRFLLKFWRKRARLPCMGPTESLYTHSPVVLAKVSVSQAFWRKILHIFTTDVGELFAQFRQSFWRNH